jgi:hypothetical protein
MTKLANTLYRVFVTLAFVAAFYGTSPAILDGRAPSWGWSIASIVFVLIGRGSLYPLRGI